MQLFKRALRDARHHPGGQALKIGAEYISDQLWLTDSLLLIWNGVAALPVIFEEALEGCDGIGIIGADVEFR